MISVFFRLMLATVFCFSIFLFTAISKMEAQHLRLQEPLTIQQIASSVPQPQTLQLMSLGHSEAMADLVWLDALSYFGGNRALARDVTWLDPHINAITELDPHFRLVYEWAGTVIMYGGKIDNRSVMASNRLLEEGIERFPEDWMLCFMLAINYYFEMTPTTEEERTRYRELGIYYFQRASHLPNAPAYLRLAAASVARRYGDHEIALETAMVGYLSMQNSRLDTNSLYFQLDQLLPPNERAIFTATRAFELKMPRLSITGEGGEALQRVWHPEPFYLQDPPSIAELLRFDL